MLNATIVTDAQYKPIRLLPTTQRTNTDQKVQNSITQKTTYTKKQTEQKLI